MEVPRLYRPDNAWVNINQTLLEMGPEYGDTIAAHSHNLGLMLLPASSEIAPFPSRLVKSRVGRLEVTKTIH